MTSHPPATQERASVERVHRVRLILAAVIITCLLGALCVRLYVIQVLDHERYALSARRMRSASEPVPAYRGDIRTKDGVLLARDVVDYELGIDPSRMSLESVKAVVKLVSDAVGRPAEYRRERLRAAIERKEKEGRYVRLATEVPDSLVKEIESALSRVLKEDELKDFVVTPRPRRAYPREDLASHVVGVVDADGQGIQGVEKSFGSYLSRRDGYREVIKDATQKTRIFKVGNLEVAPVGGYEVYLTIESTLQAIVEEELEAGVKREKAEAGLFLLLDANTGDVLAMASYPAFDPNRFGEYPEEERKRRRGNRVLESLYEPGSVVKPFYAAYCLEKRLIHRDQLMTSLVAPPVTWDGGKRAHIGRRVVTDVHEHEGMTFEGAIVNSSNIAFSIIGLKLGKQGIFDVVDRFGFNRSTGIDLPAEASKAPWAPPSVWHPMYSPVSASFGYEIMLSPVQLCRAFAALVNGGYLLKPRVIERIVRDGETTTFPSRQIEGQPISEETSRTMREILRLVVEEGTAKWLRIEGFPFGGKTGTSNLAKRAGYTKEDYLASFEAFAPVDRPEYVALCMIEKPKGSSIYGGMVAGPVVAEVFRRIFRVPAETKLSQINKLAKKS